MITSETPYKLAEIIRLTWPQLYKPVKPLNELSLRDDDNIDECDIIKE